MAFWDPDFWAAGFWITDFWEGDATTVTTATTTGTATNVPIATIVSTGGSVIIELFDDTFIAAGTGKIGTLAQSNAFVAALSATSSPTNGWNAEVRDSLTNAELTRTSNTIATIAIPATGTYNPGATETIIPVIQAAILTTSGIDVDSTSFKITGDPLEQDIVSSITSNITSNIVG